MTMAFVNDSALPSKLGATEATSLQNKTAANPPGTGSLTPDRDCSSDSHASPLEGDAQTHTCPSIALKDDSAPSPDQETESLSMSASNPLGDKSLADERCCQPDFLQSVSAMTSYSDESHTLEQQDSTIPLTMCPEETAHQTWLSHASDCQHETCTSQDVLPENVNGTELSAPPRRKAKGGGLKASHTDRTTIAKHRRRVHKLIQWFDDQKVWSVFIFQDLRRNCKNEEEVRIRQGQSGAKKVYKLFLEAMEAKENHLLLPLLDSCNEGISRYHPNRAKKQQRSVGIEREIAKNRRKMQKHLEWFTVKDISAVFVMEDFVIDSRGCKEARIRLGKSSEDCNVCPLIIKAIKAGKDHELLPLLDTEFKDRSKSVRIVPKPKKNVKRKNASVRSENISAATQTESLTTPPVAQDFISGTVYVVQAPEQRLHPTDNQYPTTILPELDPVQVSNLLTMSYPQLLDVVDTEAQYGFEEP